jgi:glycosyltransferase involved in cell wall biosynthesis
MAVAYSAARQDDATASYFAMAEVSVVIPAFNRWPMLAEAVRSVLAQRIVDFELIVVDDGSTDETSVRLRHLLDELALRQHSVRIFRTENRGPAAARNRGVAAARAPFIAFLDSDDLWHPDKLHRQLEYMKHKPESLASQTDEVWLRGGVRVNPGRRHRKHSGDFFIESLRTCLVSPSAVMMRTSTFQQLGGFDEDLRAAEDYDLWLRLLLVHSVELIPEPLVIRRSGHPGQLSATVTALDRFRILGLLKLLIRTDLTACQRKEVCDVLIEKCRIYGNGAARRGKREEADWIARLSAMANLSWRQLADGALEDAIDELRFKLSADHICADCCANGGG